MTQYMEYWIEAIYFMYGILYIAYEAVIIDVNASYSDLKFPNLYFSRLGIRNSYSKQIMQNATKFLTWNPLLKKKIEGFVWKINNKLSIRLLKQMILLIVICCSRISVWGNDRKVRKEKRKICLSSSVRYYVNNVD